jgi:hypothetical protein
MKIFPSTQEMTIAINENEHLCVTGDLNDYTFTYHIYSEGFETWIKQDLFLLNKYHSDSFEKIVKKIETQLLREGSQNESTRDL